jgi:hypothetical protein
MKAVSAVFACLVVVPALSAAEPRAARSVHLWWAAPDAVAFYNELTVDESVPGSYFMACGFKHGYFGIQEKRDADDKVVLFSVWDPGDQNDPNSVPKDRRVEVLHQDKEVRIGRFGNEGTGAQCFFAYKWQKGQTCRFLVRAAVEGEKTSYAAYFYVNESKEWKHLATFRTLTKGDRLRGLYSFVEDFRRDGASVKQRRSARYGNGWVETPQGRWEEIGKATFTADGTPLENIDAGVKDGRFYLATGGETQNTTKLRSVIERPRTQARTPDDLPR